MDESQKYYTEWKNPGAFNVTKYLHHTKLGAKRHCLLLMTPKIKVQKYKITLCDTDEYPSRTFCAFFLNISSIGLT